jgi:murein DD-endopeptidase MepM/ murein hydrolase activator NlpD
VRNRFAVVAALAICAVPSVELRADDAIKIATAARAIQPGELLVLTITMSVPVEHLRVRAFARDAGAFSVGPRSWRALIGIDLDVAPGLHHVSVEGQAGAQKIQTTYELRVRPHTFPTRRLSVDEAFVNPPAEMETRIQQEAVELQRIWKRSAPERLWSGHFVRPVPGEAVSRFGTRSVFNGQPRNPHSGADFMSPTGTPIHAPNGGRVMLARELYFSGNTVVIDHGLGVFSLLAHLSVIDVHEDDTVAADQIVGRVGATGRVTGAHLHWAVRIGEARVDPLSVLALLGSGSGSITP